MKAHLVLLCAAALLTGETPETAAPPKISWRTLQPGVELRLDPGRDDAFRQGGRAHVVRGRGLHILFVTRAARESPAEIQAALNGAATLLVGETERFAERGGMVGFVREGENIRFQLNLERVAAAGLKASAKLASVARLVTLRRAQEDLRQALDAAEAASVAKSRFLATMSHEIRTPIHGVMGMNSLLLGTELTPEQRKYAELVKRSGDNLMQVIDDILDLSKIEAARMELEPTGFDLRTVMASAADLVAMRAREKGLQFDSSIAADVPCLVRGDAGRLRQIVTNLIGNAVKFTEAGFVRLQVTKAAEEEERLTLRFLVQDSGIGIPGDKLGLIFESFIQGDGSTTRRFGGTGLGLAICKQLVKLMGGDIGVESTVGKGTTFWFTAMLEKQAAMDLAPPEAAVDPFSATAAARRGARLLLAEDDPISQTVLRTTLENLGYQVDVAANGRAALHALAGNDYALVLMDCMMPEMDGYEATMAIRERASEVRNHAIPVIALTANAMREDHLKSLAAGMNDHLTKPFEIPRLLAVLEKWL